MTRAVIRWIVEVFTPVSLIGLLLLWRYFNDVGALNMVIFFYLSFGVVGIILAACVNSENAHPLTLERNEWLEASKLCLYMCSLYLLIKYGFTVTPAIGLFGLAGHYYYWRIRPDHKEATRHAKHKTAIHF